MKDDKMILYVQTSNAPERQYSPLVLARSAKAMGQNPVLYYLGMGLMMCSPARSRRYNSAAFPVLAR